VVRAFKDDSVNNNILMKIIREAMNVSSGSVPKELALIISLVIGFIHDKKSINKFKAERLNPEEICRFIG